ncbi:hypothetical protein FZC84_04400 [Rossellomorea vietnamensis]|uniref:Uncharacterized protein n=1 Tax=Rossellomorea vietnamensis TaxID=218284 RepID=A0A5D4MGG6_9BACI|nr:hypothetical protein [Rossellomorea vietnamensis]TYS00742.1 hypothetical protein FZC84_04400 [Rossellomorea vietnamensis]
MKGKHSLRIAGAAVIFISWWVFMLLNPPARESIIFFPLNEKANYESANTLLTLKDTKVNDVYEVNWKITSVLDQDAYLRQDVGFLYFNGRLRSKLSGWEQNTDRIVEEDTAKGKESSLLQAISFHYSEIHENEDNYTSAQSMSDDQLYVIDSNFSPLSSFRKPDSVSEKEWKSILDKVTSQQLQYNWKKAMEEYSINGQDYLQIPLIELPAYNASPPKGLKQQQWNEIVGNLWEGLYKNYFLGIKTNNGKVVDPLDSSMPLILIRVETGDLLVLFTTQEGEHILLQQKFPV